MINKTTNELHVFDNFIIDRSLLKWKEKEKSNTGLASFTVDGFGNLTGGSTRIVGVGDNSDVTRVFNVFGEIEGDAHYWDGNSYEIRNELHNKDISCINNFILALSLTMDIKINKMKNLKIGDKVLLTEEAKEGLFLPDGIEYTIKDILEEENVEYKYVLNAEEFGKDWVQFFDETELILMEE